MTLTDIEYIRARLDTVCDSVAKLAGQSNLLPILCRWVVFPLIVIVGGLAGVNILL